MCRNAQAGFEVLERVAFFHVGRVGGVHSTRKLSSFDKTSIVNLVRSTLALKSSTEAIIQRWGAEQLDAASSRAEAELEDALLQLPGGLNLDSDIWEQGSKALPVIAGVGLIAASVAAIPTVISFATVSTSFLAFWGTATISWPLFALGVRIPRVCGHRIHEHVATPLR